MRKILCAAVVAALLTLAAGAGAKQSHAKPSLCERAYVARVHVVHRFGPRAPGRNICRRGVVFNPRRHQYRMAVQHGFHVRPASVVEKAKYLAQLRHLLAPPPPYLMGSGRPPGHPPAGVFGRSYAPTGVAACIVSRESGGNPQAVNGQYHGLAQWSPEAWSRMGGHRYASDPLGASYEQQLRVLSYGLAHYGTRDWSAYDGC